MDHDQINGVVFLIGVVVLLPAFWIIFRKAGFSPVLSLFLILPGIGWLIATAILAFAKWPRSAQP